MDMMKKLTKLLLESDAIKERDLDDEWFDGEIEDIAAHLIANGVTFADERRMFFIKRDQKGKEEFEQIIGSGPVILSVCENSIIPIHPERWIPVTERLPEEWEDVLVWSWSGFCEVAVYLGTPGKWRVCWNHTMLEDNSVTHWMPLPEPPKGE